MFVINDWLDLHRIDRHLISDCVFALRSGSVPAVPPEFFNPHAVQNATVPVFERAGFIAQCVKPALSAMLDDFATLDAMIDQIIWTDLPAEHGSAPHSIDNGQGNPPSICMRWTGTAEDMMCLAHEVGHAVQHQRSNGSFMPPIARETCAFLAELALMDWARAASSELGAALVKVWLDENARYLGDDADNLLSGMKALTRPYDYRMNYPLARVLAVALFARQQPALVSDLFNSGNQAMAFLPLTEIADRASDLENYLPPLPAMGTDGPEIAAYRCLGAIALLDIDGWKGESETRIDEYYQSVLGHLQKQTAFIGLRPDRKPLGYATWSVDAANHVTLHRQCAPFGDHLVLQRTLERHLASGKTVAARQSRSARPEQPAW